MLPPSENGSTPIINYLGPKIAKRKVKGPGGKEIEVDEDGQLILN